MSTTAAAPDAPGKVGAKTNKPVAQTRTGPVTHSHKVIPGSFEMENHYYTKVLNATIHPLVSYFFNLRISQIVARYKHLNPLVDKQELLNILTTPPNQFRWAGADLFYCTNEKGNRQMVVVETNSCPSGQKSMPLRDEHDDLGGYRRLIERTLKPVVDKNANKVPGGALCVIFDKNIMEASGYANVIADVFDEEVMIITFYEEETNPGIRWKDDIMYVLNAEGEWKPIRCAFRYVTQRPWTRFPAGQTKTLVLNPVVACLAGGRNKLVAAKAYEFFNNSNANSNLTIRTPETIRDLNKSEIPFWVASFGGYACIKQPYGNAGQGVYTITCQKELDDFMAADTGDYDQYIVQSLVGSYEWSSTTRHGQLFHVGTIPDKQGRLYVADVRFMIHYDFTMNQWRPLVMYSRRARTPLLPELTPDADSWNMLGTNLSYHDKGGAWATDASRLLIADRRDFNKLGIGMDDLIDGFIQTVLATVAIDGLATQLLTSKDDEGETKTFNHNLFLSLNKDTVLSDEILLQAQNEKDFDEKNIETEKQPAQLGGH